MTGTEFAMIDTMTFGLDPDSQAAEIEAIRGCMHEQVADFQVDPDSGFEDLDDVADKADDGQAMAVEIMDEFEAALAQCN